jgi:hypothetical protein
MDRVDLSVERLEVCVLDAEQKLPAHFPRVEPVEKSGTRRADVQVTGW